MVETERVYFRDIEVAGGEKHCLVYPLRIGLETRCRASYGQRGITRTIDKPCCIFQYTLAGEGIFEDDHGIHHLPRGCGFLCESHDPRIAYRYPAGRREPWNFLYVSFAADPLTGVVGALGDRIGRVVELPLVSPVIMRLRRLLELPNAPLFMTAGEAVALVFALLGEIAAAADVAEDSPEDFLLKRIQAQIQQWLPDGRIDLQELAVAVGMSRGHLCRFFNRRTGLTPYQYILRKQMLLSCQWLLERQLTVKEIAERLGFATAANFIRSFKTVTGMTTRELLRHGHLPNL